jgi:hypothetical protein
MSFLVVGAVEGNRRHAIRGGEAHFVGSVMSFLRSLDAEYRGKGVSHGRRSPAAGPGLIATYGIISFVTLSMVMPAIPQEMKSPTRSAAGRAIRSPRSTIERGEVDVHLLDHGQE